MFVDNNAITSDTITGTPNGGQSPRARLAALNGAAALTPALSAASQKEVPQPFTPLAAISDGAKQQAYPARTSPAEVDPEESQQAHRGGGSRLRMSGTIEESVGAGASPEVGRSSTSVSPPSALPAAQRLPAGSDSVRVVSSSQPLRVLDA